MNKHDKSFLHGSNTAFIEALFKAYSRDPTSVEPSWRAYFDEISGTEAKVSKANGVAPTGVNVAPLVSGAGPEPELRSVPAEAEAGAPTATVDSIRALMLIRAHRVRGHLLADLDPLRRNGDVSHPELDPASYGFTDGDYDHPIYVDGVFGMKWATLRQVVSVVRETYCGHIGVEFMHIQNAQQKAWIQMAMESSRNRANLNHGNKLEILHHLEYK